MTDAPIKAPLRIAGLVYPDGAFKFYRENSGALIIMEGPDDVESRRIGTIDMQIKPKRGEGWRTEDPEQEAIAKFIVDAVNEKLAREGK